MTAKKQPCKLEQQYRSRLQRFQKQLQRYLRTTDVDAVHDLRTALRRLESSYGLFPKSVRSADSRKYMRLGKKLFRLNSQIRDSDIILEKISRWQSNGATDQADIRQLRDLVTARRAERLDSALKLATKLDKLDAPVLHASQAELEYRLHEHADRRLERIALALPLLLTGEGSSEALHTMRKELKKLYYLLEMHVKQTEHPLMRSLKEIQRLAGKVHDCDITITYLNDCSKVLENGALPVQQEDSERHQLFAKLVEQLDDFDWQVITELA